ncbi:hypothetical protein [Christiangramia sp.]|uniref:hypothetical protein n=1 Tax=Christiangramia sp. TaxID=1931228 RepID=UPI00262D990D|nr:hypothetical protein [Christiangramia sp.]
MRKFISCTLIIFLAFTFLQCNGQTKKTNDNYTYKSGSFDGIGKFYKGREINQTIFFVS